MPPRSTWLSGCRRDSRPAADTATILQSMSCPSGVPSISAQSSRWPSIVGSSPCPWRKRPSLTSKASCGRCSSTPCCARCLKRSATPMDLVRITGGTLREEDPIVLTPEQFRRLLCNIITEPHRTMVIVAICLGLRRSELAGLKWSDFDWLNQEVLVQRSVIANRVDAVKTKRSKARLPLDPALTEVLQNWRSLSEFKADDGWVWASPWVAGAMPLYTNAIQRDYLIPAGQRAGLGNIGWHTLRHTYRSWLDQTKAPMTVQKDLMRHADIKTTMNVYGKAMAEPMREANSEVVRLVIQ